MSDVTRFMIEYLEDVDGDFYYYSKAVRENQEIYRTLDRYISARMDKEELANRLGLTSTRAFEHWGTNGMKFQRAMECAVALKLNLKEANEFLIKYAGMRKLYPAGKEDFRWIYILIYREQLEKQFPYQEKESVKMWMERVFSMQPFLNEAKRISEIQKHKERGDSKEKNATRVATKTYLDILMEQSSEKLSELTFREAGEKALEYLDELAKDTPFEKNYGNRSSGSQEDQNERNGSIRISLFEEEEKKHYRGIRKKLENGTIPHRDELIQFCMGTTLNMKREQVDNLLMKSGYEPLQARNLYEGLLLTIYLYEERLENDEDTQLESDLDYLDFQVFVSEKVDEALEYLKDITDLLLEVPRWYLNKEKRLQRIEKRYFSDMLNVMSERMTRTWKDINRMKTVSISEETLRKAAVNQIFKLKMIYCLNPETYQNVLDMILKTEMRWGEIVKSGVLYGMEREMYISLLEEILGELDNYYRNLYAPKMKRSAKKGQSGGR